MQKLKYVIIDDCFPIIFGEAHKHSDFSRNRLGKPTSAGFCHIHQAGEEGMTVSCFGKSVSLEIESQPGDAQIIEKLLNGDD